MSLERSFAVFAALLLFWSGSAKAARNAWVVGNATSNPPVLQIAPKPDAPTLLNLQPGDPITISNYPTNGYYRARSASGQIGWIAVTSIGNTPPANTPSPVPAPASTMPVSSPPVSSATQAPPPTADLDLDIPQPPPDVPLSQAPTQAPVAATPVAATPVVVATPPPVSYPYVDVQPTPEARIAQEPETPAPEPAPTRLPYELKAFGGMQSLQTVIAFNQIGATLFSTVTYLGMQFGVPVNDRIFLLLRLEHLFNSISEDNYDFSMSGTPLMAGLSYSFLPQDSSIRLRGSLLLGIDLATTLSATATNDPAPNTTEVETQTFTEMAKLDLEIPIAHQFAIFAEGGYRFLDSASVSPSSLTSNGSSIFQQNGSTVPMQLSFTGFFGGAGLAFYL